MTAVDPIGILQALVREDTTNPPGNEAKCIRYLNNQFTQAGFTPLILGKNEERTNLVVKFPGRGEAPPLLLQGHVDVVTTSGQAWTHDPFGAEIIDGEVWGRGTLDDKGCVAMMTSALLNFKARGVELPGDVIFVALADEELGADYGAKYLVSEHPDLFDGVKYAIGEGGGPSVTMAGRKMYPIMVAEKQICTIRLTFTGNPGHGSMPLRGQAMAKLSRALRLLDRKMLPVHVLPSVKRMVRVIADGLGFPARLIFNGLAEPALADYILRLLGEQAVLLAPMLHNTVSPTILHASDKINVIPGTVTLDLDGRLLPGFGPEDMVSELNTLLGDDMAIDVLNYEAGPEAADMKGFDVLAHVIRDHDVTGTPLPHLLSGVTDARHFAKLGIQSYGFVPTQIPDGYISTIHGINERVPVDGFLWGCKVFEDALTKFWFD